MRLPSYKNKSTVKNNSKCIKMAINNKLKISWKNGHWPSVIEHDVLRLRDQPKNSPGLKMTDYRMNTQIRENNLY